MRAAVALYAFDWLGAEVAESEAAAWNQQSLGVSRSLGYELNGVTRASWGGKAQEVQKVRLTPATFNRPDWQLKVEGHEATAKYLGIHLAAAASRPLAAPAVVPPVAFVAGCRGRRRPFRRRLDTSRRMGPAAVAGRPPGLRCAAMRSFDEGPRPGW